MNTSQPVRLPSVAAKITELRELVARQSAPVPLQRNARMPTNVSVLDQALEGGLIKGGIVELVSERTTSGASTLLRAVLNHVSGQGFWTVLIDGRDSFDPSLADTEMLPRLLWLRCHTAAEAIQSADLLLRDGNLPLVCLDLRSNAAAELRKIPGSTWYRLQRILELTATAFLSLTPWSLIPCADVRLELQGRFSLPALDEEPGKLLEYLQVRITRKRMAFGSGQHADETTVPWREVG